MPSTDQIQAAVDRYLAAVANGTAGDIAAGTDRPRWPVGGS